MVHRLGVAENEHCFDGSDEKPRYQGHHINLLVNNFLIKLYNEERKTWNSVGRKFDSFQLLDKFTFSFAINKSQISFSENQTKFGILKLDHPSI